MRRMLGGTLATCEFCNVTYIRGNPEDEKEHGRQHRQRQRNLNARPSAKLSAALDVSPEGANWVYLGDNRWKQNLVYNCAIELHRELHYRIMWEEDGEDDPGTIGYLFVDHLKRVVGACCFRLESDRVSRYLDWVWICPPARRAGHLLRAWPQFRARFGDFTISGPISPAMGMFIAAVDASARRS